MYQWGGGGGLGGPSGRFIFRHPSEGKLSNLLYPFVPGGLPLGQAMTAFNTFSAESLEATGLVILEVY